MANYPAVEHFQQHISKMFMFTCYNIFNITFSPKDILKLIFTQISSKNWLYPITLLFLRKLYSFYLKLLWKDILQRRTMK